MSIMFHNYLPNSKLYLSCFLFFFLNGLMLRKLYLKVFSVSLTYVWSCTFGARARVTWQYWFQVHDFEVWSAFFPHSWMTGKVAGGYGLFDGDSSEMISPYQFIFVGLMPYRWWKYKMRQFSHPLSSMVVSLNYGLCWWWRTSQQQTKCSLSCSAWRLNVDLILVV